MRSLRELAFVAFALAACGGDDGDSAPYPTFQECFDDHNKVEGFDTQTAIKICCISHPIGTPPVGPNVVCGEDQTACEAFVDDNLAEVDATGQDITDACAGYLVDREL